LQVVHISEMLWNSLEADFLITENEIFVMFSQKMLLSGADLSFNVLKDIAALTQSNVFR